METKPFNLQSPEQIAKEYGGNKQKIAEAMQMGVLDPTAGTLAGMFIDRMRSAAQAESVPQQSIAQQVFAPPMPATPGAGLAGTPQAAAMQAQMPPMGPGMAPPIGPEMAPPMAPPMGPEMAPPAGLAAAPMGPPGMAAGGLTTLPIPDGMFDEPNYGGYAGGGLVAFAAGDVVDEEELTGDPMLDDPENTIVVPGLRAKEPPAYNPNFIQPTVAVLPPELGGFGRSLASNRVQLEEEAPRQTAEAGRYQEYLNRMLSPEEQRGRRQEDMWMALGQIGARMATTPGSLLQAISTGVGEALPGVREAATARRGEERGARQALLAEERTGNAEVMARTNVAMDMLGRYNTIAEALNNRALEDSLTRLGFNTDILKTNIMAGAGYREALLAAAVNREEFGVRRETNQLQRDIATTQAVSEYLGTPAGMVAMRRSQERGENPTDFMRDIRGAFGGGSSGGTDVVDLGTYTP
jgi:hypothetical protein